MKPKWKTIGIVFSVMIFTLFFCEYLNYFLVINQCSWPEFQKDYNEGSAKTFIKAMFLADTHLLGPYRGHWFDKLRREWQMYRAFQSSIYLYQPEIVFILGDLFDEGQWCNKSEFEKYVTRFFSLFEIPTEMQMYVVPGNHDVGFHHVMTLNQKLLFRFEKVFNFTGVQFLNLKGNYFVLINSMAMEGDECNLCSEAKEMLKNIADELKCVKYNKQCMEKTKLTTYSRPIVLQHFPMFRKSDSKCSEIDEAPPNIKNQKFRQKWDCLSKNISEMIYDEFDPRLIITGHVHYGCHIIHRKDIHEYTLSSFSWRNQNNPTFMLAKLAPDNYVVKKCEIPKETTVVLIYSCVILAIVVWILYTPICKKCNKVKNV